MFSLFLEALGYKFSYKIKHVIFRLLMFDIWILLVFIYGLKMLLTGELD